MMNKPNSKLSRVLPPLLGCCITLTLFLLLNALYGIFPCGQNTVVWCDMEQQAVPLLLQFRQLVQSGESISFSQLNAGGMHFYSVFFFFLSNPFSLLILLTDTPADQLVTLLVVLKLSLAAGTATFWFRSRIPALPAALAVLLGVMYGCSGYGLFYYQNLMWLDIMAMLPLLMFSMRRMLKKADPLPYLLTLSAMMLLCFYLCYMIVLFVVIYMAVSLRTTVPKAGQPLVARRFLLASALAACLTACVWLPCLIQVQQSARGVSLTEVLAASLLFDHFGDKVTMLGCTALGFAALPMLWQKDSPRISSRRRDRRILLLLTAAALLDPINIMWHGGSYQAFPLRWGMIPILLMLTLAGKQLSVQYDAESCAVIPKSKTALIFISCMLTAFGFGLYLHCTKQEILYSYVNTLWVSTENALWMLMLILLLVIVYSLVITFWQHRLLSARTAVILLAVLFAGEFAFQYDCYFGAAANPDPLYAQTVRTAESFVPAEDTARLKMTKKYAHANMLGAVGYPTLAHYTSLTREDFIRSMKRLGYSSYWMEVSSLGGTILSDALWNVRYQLGVRTDFPSWMHTLREFDALAIAESSFSMPSALCCGAPPEALANLPSGSRIDVQEYLAETLLGCGDVITRYEPTALQNVTLTQNDAGETSCTLQDPDKTGEIRYSLFIPSHQALYFDLYSQTGTELAPPQNGAVAVRYNSRTLDDCYPENNGNGFLLLGEPEKQYVVISITVLHDFTCESFGVFGMETEPLAAAMQRADGAELHYQNGVYTAECRTDAPQTLLLAAAFDEGFSAEINGEAAEVYRVNGCQLGVKLPAGENHVVLRYRVPGLRIGLMMGGGALLVALLLLCIRKRLPKSLLHHSGRIAASCLQICYFIVLAGIYLLPLILWLLGKIAFAVTGSSL